MTIFDNDRCPTTFLPNHFQPDLTIVFRGNGRDLSQAVFIQQGRIPNQDYPEVWAEGKAHRNRNGNLFGAASLLKR